MTTEYSKSKNMPADQYDALLRRCLDSYSASQDRRRFWRAVGVCIGIEVLIVGLALALFYLNQP